MTNKTVYVVAHLTAIPDKVEAVEAVLREMIEPTRQEPGCIKYQLLQNNSQPTDFTFVEEWTDNEALNAHAASSHIQAAFVVKLKGLLAAVADIRIYHLLV